MLVATLPVLLDCVWRWRWRFFLYEHCPFYATGYLSFYLADISLSPDW